MTRADAAIALPVEPARRRVTRNDDADSREPRCGS